MAVFHCNLAEAYRALGQLDRAVGCCRTALRLEPDYPDAANNLGLALQAQGKCVEAADQFRAALRLRPDFALAQSNLANALRQQGDKAQALAALPPGGPARSQPGRGAHQPRPVPSGTAPATGGARALSVGRPPAT